MRTIIASASLLAALVLAPTAQAAFISGDVTGGGSFNGQVNSNTAWVQDNPFDGEEVNFWTFTATAGQTVSINVTSLVNEMPQLLDAGVSLYFGEVTASELLYSGFNHADSFANNSLVATTNTYFGTPGNNASLLEILLTQSGLYTIAVGGEGAYSLHDSYGYDLNVQVVPVPAAVWLLASGLLGLGALRRRQRD